MAASWIALLASGPAFAMAQQTLTDAELDQLRGGFSLPNGLQIALTVQTQTSVDGAVVLHSVFKAVDGAPSVAAYVSDNGQKIPAAPQQQASAPVTPAVSVSFDRSNGVSVTRNASVPTTVSVTQSGGTSPSTEGLKAIDLSSGGVDTASGRVSQIEGGTNVRFDAGDLTVVHLAGRAFGTLIVNGGNDRLVDTNTTVSIDLAGGNPANIGSTMLRVDNVAVEAMRMGIR